jgi:hypothetical protein
MDILVKIEVNESLEPMVSGRELHKQLEVQSNYTTWFDRMKDYGFTENADYVVCFPNLESEGRGGQNKVDHLIKLDMAKEICMIQRTERGKQARQYFIQVEKDYNSPEKIMARALRIAEQELSNLKITVTEQAKRIEESRPKVLFAESVSASDTSILIGDLAKLLKQNGYDTGQKRLFEELRQRGFLMKAGSSKNLPTQKAMELGLFEVKESTINNPDGSVRVTKTTKVTGKGQVYFVNLFLGKPVEEKVS